MNITLKSLLECGRDHPSLKLPLWIVQLAGNWPDIDRLPGHVWWVDSSEGITVAAEQICSCGHRTVRCGWGGAAPEIVSSEKVGQVVSVTARLQPGSFIVGWELTPDDKAESFSIYGARLLPALVQHPFSVPAGAVLWEK